MRLDGEFPIATSGGVLPVPIGPVPPNARRCGGGHLAAVSDFLGKDVAVVRYVAAELGAGLGAVGDMIDKATW